MFKFRMFVRVLGGVAGIYMRRSDRGRADVLVDAANFRQRAVHED